MAPTTAASEGSSVRESTCPFLSVLKDVHNMRALIRRGSGINNRSRTVSKTSLRGVEAGFRRMRVQDILGKDGGPGPGVSRGVAKTRKNQKNAPEFCAGISSKTNGSGYPLSVPAVAPPLELPTVQHATQGSADMYVYICIYMLCIYIYIHFKSQVCLGDSTRVFRCASCVPPPLQLHSLQLMRLRTILNTSAGMKIVMP